MGLKKLFFSNTRKPKGFLGKIMINRMNEGHAKLSDWGLSYLKDANPVSIADFGCGGGINVAKLLKMFPNTKVTGFDYSDVSVKESKKVNDTEIKQGFCNIVQGNVSKTPFENETFDIITAVETVYFWPGPVISFKEVFRTLKPGGIFMIVNEFDGISEREKKYEKLIDGLKLYDNQELINYLKESGFKDIKLFHDTERHWVTFLAKK
jgi:ubiquinone/menaquinone biosynthesis C-methylase UbiE